MMGRAAVATAISLSPHYIHTYAGGMAYSGTHISWMACWKLQLLPAISSVCKQC